MPTARVIALLYTAERRWKAQRLVLSAQKTLIAVGATQVLPMLFAGWLALALASLACWLVVLGRK